MRTIASQTINCSFIGYAHDSVACRLLQIESNSILESKSAKFLKKKSYEDKIKNDVQYTIGSSQWN